MKLYFRNFRFAMFGVSILCLALGLAILLWPDYAMKILCYGFGAVLVISGLLQVGSYLTGERVGLLRKLLLISGILSAVIGVWVLLTPDRVLTLTMIVLGIVLIYHGAMDIKYGFDIKACDGKNWGAALFFGLATCGVGVLILVNPFDAAEKLMIAAGIGFLFDGLTDIFTVFTVAHAKAQYERLAGAEPVIQIEPSAAAEQLEEGSAPAPAAAEPEETPAAAETAGENGEEA